MSRSPTRHRLSFLLFWVVAVGLLLAPGASIRADDLTEEEEERLEAIERHTERGWKAFRSGNHDEVLARMDRIERYAPESPLPDFLRARVELRQGAYEEALERLVKAVAAHPAHPGLEAAHFDALHRLGRIDEMRQVAEARLLATETDLIAQVALGTALEERGRREEALAAYRLAIRGYTRNAPAEYVPWVARAAIRATWLSTSVGDDLTGEAGKLLSRYLDAHPEDQDVLMMVGDLYASQRGTKTLAKANTVYRQRLLKHNSELAHARVGLARTLLVFWQEGRAIEELERALKTNPNLVEALSLLAAIHVGDGYYDRAEKLLDRALAVNPTDRHTRAVKAARAWIMGDREAFAALEKEALDWDPTDGRFYVVVSDLVGERQRRYDVAAELAAKAVAADANDPLGYITLGEAQMNLGQTEEARKNFEVSIDKSKGYRDVKRDNWLDVLGVLDDFDTWKTENFVIRSHPSETKVMERYLPDLMEASWNVLTEKYGYTPTGPVRVDSFHRNDDFSVRSVGVTGLPALGICFGEVIGVLGPTARPVGQFSWASTAWHEFAHTITLGLSKGQVPRWLTEGLSVYEEKMRRASWARPMARMLYDRYRNDRLLRMDKINRAFRGPDIGFAYFQGGLISEHLTEARGFDVIPAMLKEFAKDRTTAQVFQDVLELKLEDYDRMFKEFIEKRVGYFKLVPRWDQESLTEFQARVAKDPTDAEAWTRLGWAQLQRGRQIDAGSALAKAMALAPDAPEVVLLQGRMAQLNRRADLATQAYERYLGMGEDDYETRLFLAEQELAGGGDSGKAIAHLEAAKACFPFAVGKKNPYVILAQLHRGAGDVEKAIAELEAYAEIAGEDYGVRKELKDWYRGKEDHARVIDLCEQMVEISPFGANKGEAPDLELHRDYANALLALDRKDEAIRELEVQVALLGGLEEATRIEAGAVAVHLRLGEMYLAADRPLDALSEAVAALRLSPGDADARMLRARAEEAAGYR